MFGKQKQPEEKSNRFSVKCDQSYYFILNFFSFIPCEGDFDNIVAHYIIVGGRTPWGNSIKRAFTSISSNI